MTNHIFEPIVNQYDFFNRFFSLHFDTIWRKILVSNVQRSVTTNANNSLLDIGCGTGDIIKTFKSNTKIHFSHTVGIDISATMLKRFMKNKDCDATLLKANGTNLPFKNKSFDIVSMAFVIRNINNINLLFNEIYRVLKKDGIFIFLEFSMPKNYIQKRIFINYLNLWVQNVGDYLTNSKSYSYLSKTIVEFAKINLVNILAQLNFTMIKYQYLTGGIVQLGVFKKEID